MKRNSWGGALLLASTIAPSIGAEVHTGIYGEVVEFPAGYGVEAEMRQSIEILRFFPAGSGAGREDFQDEPSYAKKNLMQLLVIPKQGSKVSSVLEVRKKKEADFVAEGLNYRIRPAAAFSEDSFFVNVRKPYRMTHAYIEGEHYFFSVMSGRIDALFKSVVDGLVYTAQNLKPPVLEEPEKPAPQTNDPERWAKEKLLNHRFRMTQTAADELGLPRIVSIGTYLAAFAAEMERKYGVRSEKTWKIEKVKPDVYRLKHRIKMLQMKLFKKKFRFAWHVDLRTHEFEGLNSRSRIFFLPETQVE